MPNRKSLINLVDSEKDNFLKASEINENLYLTMILDRMQTEYLKHFDDNKTWGEFFLITPSKKPTLPHKYNPIHEEMSILSNQEKSLYKLALFVPYKNNCKILNNIFHETLNDLEFLKRSDSKYHNLGRFKKYLKELSKEIHTTFENPEIRVINDLKNLQLNSKSEIVL